MEKYSRFEYEKVKEILNKLRTNYINQSLVELPQGVTRIKYGLLADNYEMGYGVHPDINHSNAIEFTNMLNHWLVNPNFLKKEWMLIESKFYTKTYKQPLITFEMRQDNCLCTLVIPEKIEISSLPETLHDTADIEHKDWEVVLAGFVNRIKAFVNNNLSFD